MEALEWSGALIVLVVVVAPLTEEWVDRGALWAACRRAGSPQVALLATSALFALSHGLNGGYLFELPHRSVGGLFLGWLRWRSDSLAAPILAHATWNGISVWSEL